MAGEATALKAGRDGQQALQVRLDALVLGVAAGVADTLAKLGALPPAARFEPFAQVLTGAGAAADQPGPAPVDAAKRRARRAPAASPAAAAGAPVIKDFARVAAQAVAEAAHALAPAARGVPGLSPAVQALGRTGATVAQALGGPGKAAPAQTGAQQAAAGVVTQLLKDFEARQNPSTTAAVGQLALEGVMAGLGALGAKGAKSVQPPRGGSAVANAIAAALGPQLGHGPDSWVQGVVRATTEGWRNVDGRQAPAAAKPQAAAAPHTPAQRAASRLLPGAAAPGDKAAETPRAAAPADPCCAPPEEDAFSGALQRSLLDQAWLRGVDLR